jgi:hypothetical protein
LNKTSKVVEVVRPKTTTSYAQDISKCIPKNGTSETISALHLLPKFEQDAVRKQGTSFTIAIHGELFMVRPQQQVSKTATVVRTSTGSLVGFNAIVGG